MLNKVILMGRITVEPELKHTPSGVAVTRFTIAVERNFKDANGERAVDFINIAAWRNNAEVVCKYFHKGSLICVGGSIETGTYTDKTVIKNILLAFTLMISISPASGKNQQVSQSLLIAVILHHKYRATIVRLNL